MSRPSVLLASFDPVPAPKGASQHILANARTLSTRYEVSLATLGERPLDRSLGYRHRAFQLDEPNWLRRALAFRGRIQRLLERYTFDVHHVRSPFEGLAVPSDGCVVYEVNALYSIETAHHFPAVASRPRVRQRLRWMELALLDRAALVTTPSAVTRDYLADLGVDPARVHLVPNEPSIPIAESPAIHDRDPITLAYIGTLAGWQGLDGLLDVLVDLPARVRLRLRTGQRGARLSALRKRARKLGLSERVTFEPALTRAALADFLRSADIGVAPLVPCERNLVQGCMPIKLLDYMAAGLPLVAPEMPVTRAIVGPDYPLYARWKKRALLAQLRDLVDRVEHRRELARRGLARVSEAFAPGVARAALLEAYDTL